MERKGITRHCGECEAIQKKWGWFFVFGLLLMILGATLIGSAFSATLFSVLMFGFLLIGAGVVQIVHAVMAREWSGVFLSILLAILYEVIGMLCIANPATAALNLTFLIAAFCFIGGLFKMVSALVLRFEAWGWAFFNGIITFILGVLIYAQWPLSGLWVIGTFVGVDMLLLGWYGVVQSFQIRSATSST